MLEAVTNAWAKNTVVVPISSNLLSCKLILNVQKAEKAMLHIKRLL